MILKENYIQEQYYNLASWLSQRQLRAEAVTDGGCTIYLQTHIRETAHDLDLRLHSVIGRDGRPFGQEEMVALFDDFVGDSENPQISKASSPLCIDREYAGMMAVLYGHTNPAPVTYGSYFDKHGYGTTIKLVDLRDVHRDLMKRVQTLSLPRILAGKDEAEIERLGRKRQTAIDDGFALSVLLGNEWESIPLPDGCDLREATAYRGARPKWNIDWVPQDREKLLSVAALGRKPVVAQTHLIY